MHLHPCSHPVLMLMLMLMLMLELMPEGVIIFVSYCGLCLRLAPEAVPHLNTRQFRCAGHTARRGRATPRAAMRSWTFRASQ